MKNIIENINTIVNGILESEDHFIVDVSVSGARNSQKIVVMIDGDHGVDIDVCASVSRKLSAQLDEMDVFEGNYFLEVTSPGVDYPLKIQRQYQKNIGRKVKVYLTSNKTIEGQLIDANNDHICIRKENKKEGIVESKISYTELVKTIVQISFK